MKGDLTKFFVDKKSKHDHLNLIHMYIMTTLPYPYPWVDPQLTPCPLLSRVTEDAQLFVTGVAAINYDLHLAGSTTVQKYTCNKSKQMQSLGGKEAWWREGGWGTGKG